MQRNRCGTAGALALGLLAMASAHPAAGEAQTMPALRVGQTVQGTITQADPTANEHGHLKVYRFDGREGQRVLLSLKSDQFDTYLSLGRTVAGITDYLREDDDGGGGTNSRLLMTLPHTGEYLVVAQTYGPDMSGSFFLSLDTLPRPRSKPAGSIRVGQTVQGELEWDDPVTEVSGGESPYDLYAFDARAGQRVEVEARSGDFDTYLEVGPLVGDSLEVVEQDDDGAGGEEGGTDSRLRFRVPEGGRYGIRVRSYAADTVGAYTVSLTERAQVVPPAPTPIAAGQRVEGALEATDPQDDDDAFYDAYVYRGRSGEVLTIDMGSEQFDTYLLFGRMTGGDFVQLDANDDLSMGEGDEGANPTDSRLVVTLDRDGEYVIRARSLGGDVTGPYTLRVRSSR